MEPRQNGKGGILEARELAGLFLFGERLITHSAHRYDTSQEHYRRMKPLVVAACDATGDKRLKLRKFSDTNGDESVELMGGQRLIFKARTKLSGRGFTGDVIVFDEAMYLQDLGSFVPTLSARQNPQMWFTASAPLPRIESNHLRRTIRRCRAAARGKTRKPPREAFFEWSAHVDLGDLPDGTRRTVADVDITDRRLWAQANPGLGYRLTEEFIETVELAHMTREEFALERLGLYDDAEDQAIDTVISSPAWKACRSPESEAIDPVAICFEVSLDRKWSQIGIAAPSTLGGTHVEIVENRPGTGWVIDRAIELKATHGAGHVVCNPAGPAGSLLPEAERKGLTVGILEGWDKDGTAKVHAVTGRDYQQACGAALDDITEHRWRHLGQPELDKAVANATRRDVGDAFVFDRRGDVDISPLTCVALAAWAAGQAVPVTGPSIYEERGLVTL